MTVRVGPRPPPPPPPDWAVANADRFRAALEAAWAEAEAACHWYLPDTAHRDLFIAQDVAISCPLHMAKLVTAPSAIVRPPPSVLAHWRKMVTGV